MPQDVKQLFVEIEEAARKKDFVKAEELREKLIESDPTALTEIIRSAETIEKEKTLGLDLKHLAIWGNLYKGLDEEETNCLFYNLKKVVVPPKKRILAQGGYNTRLYFIENGTVSVVSQKGEKNTVVAQLGVGDMLGEYTFTMISLCSATVVSDNEVHLRYLENSATDRWHQDFPGLYEKLTSFCAEYGQINIIESRQNKEEEKLEIFQIEGKVVAHLINNKGEKTDTYFRGALTEIHTRGCCFEFKSSKRETARALLAKNLYLSLSCKQEDEKPTFSVTGKITRVTFQLHNDYSAYVTFHRPISAEDLQRHLR